MNTKKWIVVWGATCAVSSGATMAFLGSDWVIPAIYTFMGHSIGAWSVYFYLNKAN